jgi:hypothetical protein
MMLGILLGPLGVLVEALLPDGDPTMMKVSESMNDFEEDDEPVADLASLGLASPEPEKPKPEPGQDSLLDLIRRAPDKSPK